MAEAGITERTELDILDSCLLLSHSGVCKRMCVRNNVEMGA